MATPRAPCLRPAALPRQPRVTALGWLSVSALLSLPARALLAFVPATAFQAPAAAAPSCALWTLSQAPASGWAPATQSWTDHPHPTRSCPALPCQPPDCTNAGPTLPIYRTHPRTAARCDLDSSRRYLSWTRPVDWDSEGHSSLCRTTPASSSVGLIPCPLPETSLCYSWQPQPVLAFS